MRRSQRTLAVAASGLLLLGAIGCAEDNEKAVTSESGQTKSAPISQGQYGQMNKGNATGNPYETSKYPGSSKGLAPKTTGAEGAGAPDAGAPK